MDDHNQWLAGNNAFLAAGLAWLRLKLAGRIQACDRSAPATGNVAEAEIEQAAAGMAAAARLDPPPALISLGRIFGLSRFERDILLLCAAMELDSQIAGLCAQAQGGANRPYPTFALALTLFDDPAWDVLSPKRPLRYWRLVEVNQSGSESLTTTLLRADERIVDYLKGLNYLDERLSPFLIADEKAARNQELPPSQQTTVEQIVDSLWQAKKIGQVPIIQLLGADVISKRHVALQAAAALGLRVCRMPAALLPTQTADLESLARLWQRESLLLPVALYLDAYEAGESKQDESPASPLYRFLAHSKGIVFLDVRDVRQELGQAMLAFDVTKPTQSEQQTAWQQALGSAGDGDTALLAAQFNLSTLAIGEIAHKVLRKTPAEQGSLHEALWEECLAYTRPRMDTLAQRLTPVATWDDIVLPGDRLTLLRQIASQVRQRGMVYERWGFARRMNRGLGIVALFAGESGTGKTMAAEVIATDLKLNLYRIDLSAVVSKYIGETEKNLRGLFDAAEDGGAILFFDEADALFGKRSQVRDSHDRYANIEINYLLQRLEAYRGLAILATNMKAALDEGFIRRLRFIVNFPVPELADRLRMWQQIFPPETPLARLDYERLAGFKLTGGSIHNAALNAAFLAADAGTPLTMQLVLNAIRTEILKSDRLINEEEFIWEGRD